MSDPIKIETVGLDRYMEFCKEAGLPTPRQNVLDEMDAEGITFELHTYVSEKTGNEYVAPAINASSWQGQKES